MKKILYLIVCTICLFSCKDDESQLEQPFIGFSAGNTPIGVKWGGDSNLEIGVKTNLDDWKLEFLSNEDWCRVKEYIVDEQGSRSVIINVATNLSLETREIMLRLVAGSIESQSIKLIQTHEIGGETGEDEGSLIDVKIDILAVELVEGSTYAPGVGVSKIIDGNYKTNYGAGTDSGAATIDSDIIIDFTLAEYAGRVDYVKIYQRYSFDKKFSITSGEIYYQTASSSEWIKKGVFKADVDGAPIVFQLGINHPTKIRAVFSRNPESINLAVAEFECYTNSSAIGNIEDAAQYFEDALYTKLKSSVTLEQINKIKNSIVKECALELFEQKYESEFRIRTFNSVKDPNLIRQEFTFRGQRSAYENPTGIFFSAGVPQIIMVDKVGVKPFGIRIHDFRRDGKREDFALKQGVNIITSTQSGSGYIQYWTDTNQKDIPVKVHFVQGVELGFWDKKCNHTNDDFARLIAKARTIATANRIPNAMFDVLGDYMQLVNTVNAFNVHVPNKDILGTVAVHDEMIYDQYELIGLVKHNLVPENRTLTLRTWSGPPSWGGIGANFPNVEKSMLDTQSFRDNIWLFAHEIGHGFQIPEMRDAGWEEVTNNIFSSYAQYAMADRTMLRLEHKKSVQKPYMPIPMRGNRFNNYLYQSFVLNLAYFSGHEFVRLTPLWQLTLYYMIAGEGNSWHKPDFWADIHWSAISDDVRSNPPVSWGGRYIDFTKRAIDSSDEDLSTFFIEMGLLRDTTRHLADYGAAREVIINSEMIADAVSYGSKRSKPSPALKYISANSINAFKNQLAVVGQYGQGIIDDKLTCVVEGVDHGYKLVDHASWKNATVFEVYNGNKMVDITMVGTGSETNETTIVRYPKGKYTRIEAVAWNGERTLVVGER